MNLIAFEDSGKSFQVEVDYERSKEKLSLVYRILGPIEKIQLKPQVSPARFQDRLWEETCFEVFLRQAGAKKYWEWNFDHLGNWACYEFSNYRELFEKKIQIKPRLHQFKSTKDFLLLEVEILCPQEFSEFHPNLIFKLQDGNKIHWASKMQPSPDFHQFDLFQTL